VLKNAQLRRFPHPSSLRRTPKYASLLRVSGALHLGIFEHPAKVDSFSKLLALLFRGAEEYGGAGLTFGWEKSNLE
jgi:hypothetical protein